MIITRTPFRISFFGGGSDLPSFYREQGGAVLSTTIDKYLYITCRQMPPYWNFKHQLVYGSNRERVNTIEEIEHPSIRETMRFLDINYGLDLHYNTDIPARSGMGSSSSFTVGLLKALYGLNGQMISKRRNALEAIHIEQNLIQETVGSQDQIAAAFGGFNYIIFNKDDSFSLEPMTIGEKRQEELNDHLVLIFTGFQRFAIDIEKDKLKHFEQNIKKLELLKSYVEQAVQLLNSNADICQFGKLLHEAWMLKKTLSSKVSNTEIDRLYEMGLQQGAIGGKILGAGGGGFLLFFVKPEQRKQLLTAFQSYTHVPFRFDKTGSQVIYFRGGE